MSYEAACLLAHFPHILTLVYLLSSPLFTATLAVFLCQFAIRA
jgi:hypothetical protein